MLENCSIVLLVVNCFQDVPFSTWFLRGEGGGGRELVVAAAPQGDVLFGEKTLIPAWSNVPSCMYVALGGGRRALPPPPPSPARARQR